MSRIKLDRMATRRLIKIGRLEQELAAERSIVRALEGMSFSPEQDPRVLSRVKKAYTMRRQLRENSDGKQ